MSDTHREEQELSGCNCSFKHHPLRKDHDPYCPVHGSRTANTEGGEADEGSNGSIRTYETPDVAEPRSEECRCRMGMTAPHERTSACAPGPSDVVEIVRQNVEGCVNNSHMRKAIYELLSEITRLRAEVDALIGGAPIVRCCDHCEACTVERDMLGGQTHEERLREENERLREALRKLAQLDCTLDAPMDNGARVVYAADIATQALHDSSDNDDGDP